VEKVHKIINKDQQSTILETDGRLGLSYGTYQKRILMEDLNMWQISVNSVPQLLTDEHKQRHVLVYQELLDKVRNDVQNCLLGCTAV
jgi:hypothetical protein